MGEKRGNPADWRGSVPLSRLEVIDHLDTRASQHSACTKMCVCVCESERERERERERQREGESICVCL